MEKEVDILDEKSKGKVKRPQFLTVICILTFVGSGLGILGGVWGVVPSSNKLLIESMHNMREIQEVTTPFSEAEYLEWYFYSSVAGLLGSLLCLAGALYMWRMKRIGFYFYLPGYIIPFTVSVFAIPHMDAGLEMSEFISAASVAFNGLIMIAFFIMYGVNLKHMTESDL